MSMILEKRYLYEKHGESTEDVYEEVDDSR